MYISVYNKNAKGKKKQFYKIPKDKTEDELRKSTDKDINYIISNQPAKGNKKFKKRK